MRIQQRRGTFDENNNNTIVVDRMSIDLDGSSTVVVVVGDIVWIKQDAVHFLTTPFIIEQFNGEQMTQSNQFGSREIE